MNIDHYCVREISLTVEGNIKYASHLKTKLNCPDPVK